MINEIQQAERRLYIGSSDAPVILGCEKIVKYRTIADLWLEKTGRLKPARKGDNKAIEAGNLLEPALILYAEKMLETVVQRNVFVMHEDEIRSANLDGEFIDRHGDLAIVEAKSSGILSFGVDPDDWGDEWTDEVPEHVAVQCQHQIDVASNARKTQVTRAFIPALLAGVGFRIFVYRHSKALSESLYEQEMDFWQYVKKDEPPPDELPSLAAIKRVNRPEGKTTRLPPELVESWLVANKTRLAAEKQEEEELQRMLAHLGSAEIGEVWTLDPEKGEFVQRGELSYREQSRKGYVVEDTTFRVARWKDFTAPKKARKRS